MTHTHQLHHPTALPTLLGSGSGEAVQLRQQPLLTRLFIAVQRWRHHARLRRELLTLDDRMLQDIGPTRADVEAAVNTPFWRTVTAHERRDYR